MATKKKTSEDKRGAGAGAKELAARAEKAEARADRFKAKAARYKEEAAGLRAQVETLTQQLEEAQAAAGRPDQRSDQRSEPDSSWTVVKLRAEARSRGLTGFTTKSKAELIDLLTTS